VTSSSNPPVSDLRVLMITSEWPSADRPERVPFLVQQVSRLRGMGVYIDLFTFKGNKNPLNYMRAWACLRLKYPLSQYDLIHAQFGQSGALALPTNRPLLVTFRGTDLQGNVGANGQYTWKGRILQRLSRFVARRASLNIVVSEHLKRFLPAGCAVEVIPSGVDMELFTPRNQREARRQLGLPLDKKLVLFAASCSRPVKRFGLARAAVAKLTEDFDVQLVTTGAVPHSLMPAYMNACDALLLTSSHEGSPNVVKEALACQLPVVSVPVGDVSERLRNIEGCAVCSDDSVETIAADLRQVLGRGLRVDGRPAVIDLDDRKIGQQIIRLYEKIVATHKGVDAGQTVPLRERLAG